ncbi:MAG TPA: DUF3857 and transglutaminase domain-containing protein [bacterium]|nr:DUF3857 and transglutaminase domain-containing protein [bacterium]
MRGKSDNLTRLLLTILILQLAFVYGQSNIPDKIEQAGCAEDYPGQNTVTIFDSTKVKVMDSGLSYVNEHKLIKILTTRGAKQLRTMAFRYDTLSAFIELKEARIYKKDGQVIELNSDDIYDYPAPAHMIYWGARKKMAAFGRLEPGDAVEIKKFRKGFTYALLANEDEEKFVPPMEGHFYDIVTFYSQHPVLEKYYQVTLPKDKPIQYEVYNGELQGTVLFQKDKLFYSWTKKDIEPMQREPYMVSPKDVETKLLLSTAADWEAKARWFYSVNHDYGSFEVTPEIKEKTEEIVADADTKMEKIKKLTHWVAENIRYCGLSMGEGEGYTLHKGQMTFDDRAGVCKDKAGMLVTMLRAIGFESYAAMTMARSRIDRIPADQFNHSVTLVKYDGKWKLLDPTWVPGVRELWSSAEQQQQYLMGIPEGAGLKTTPISPPENHYYRVDSKSKLHENGTLEGTLTIEADKQSGARFRRILRGHTKKEWRGVFEELAYTISPKIKIEDLEYLDPYDLSQPMHIKMEYKVPEYALVSKGEIHFTPAIASCIFQHNYLNSIYFMNVSSESRKYDFRIGSSRLLEFTGEIDLPGGYKPVDLPEWEKVDNSSAGFEANYEKGWGKIKFSEKLVLKKRRYKADEWTAFKSAVEPFQKVAKTPIVLEK